MEMTRMSCPFNVVHFSVSKDYIIIVNPDGYMYTRYKDHPWGGNIDAHNHTNSAIATYNGTYY